MSAIKKSFAHLDWTKSKVEKPRKIGKALDVDDILAVKKKTLKSR